MTMPLDEEGVKWSCEPCVRGHRSSKCQHFERLMMKVPKAGRPLAKCPHPKGSCSCQRMYAFMIRIPKGSTCLCRPLYQVPKAASETDPPTASTSGPAISLSMPGKVQKHTCRQNSLQAAPETIAKGLNTFDQFLGQQVELRSFPSETFQYPDVIYPNSDLGALTSNHTLPTLIPGQLPGLSGNIQTINNTCHPEGPKSTDLVQGQGSCCKKSVPVMKRNGVKLRLNHVAPCPPLDWAPYTVLDGNISAWQGLSEGAYPRKLEADPLQTVRTDGVEMPKPSLSQPIGASSPDLHGNAFVNDTANSQPLMNTAYGYPSIPQSAFTSEAAHICTCGNDCQCFGCVSHPLNSTTTQRVQEMGYMMAIDEENRTSEGSDSSQNAPFAHQIRPTSLANTGAIDENGNMQRSDSVCDFSGVTIVSSLDSSHSTTSPSEYQSSKQLMQPSAYYTFEYAVDLPNSCSEPSSVCICGNDCSCIGCHFHSGHHSFPVESTISSASLGNGERFSYPNEPLTLSSQQTPRIEDLMFSTMDPTAIALPLV